MITPSLSCVVRRVFHVDPRKVMTDPGHEAGCQLVDESIRAAVLLRTDVLGEDRPESHRDNDHHPRRNVRSVHSRTLHIMCAGISILPAADGTFIHLKATERTNLCSSDNRPAPEAVTSARAGAGVYSRASQLSPSRARVRRVASDHGPSAREKASTAAYRHRSTLRSLFDYAQFKTSSGYNADRCTGRFTFRTSLTSGFWTDWPQPL